MSDLRRSDYTAWQTDAEPFPDYLPYLACAEDTVLLYDRQGQAPSIGRIWEVTPVCLEGAAEERWEVVSAALDGLLLRLPEEAACQFFLIGDTTVEDDLAAFRQQTRVDGLPRTACEDRAQLYQTGASTPLFAHKGIPFHCRRMRAFCTVRLWPPPPARTGRAAFRSPQVTLQEWFAQAQGDMHGVEEILQEGLRFAGIQLQRLTPDHIKALLWRFLNPGETSLPGPYHEHCLFREQLLVQHPHVDGQGITLNGHKLVVLSAMEPPFETRAGMFVRELEFGGARAALLDLFPALCLVWNIHVMDQQMAYTRVKRHKSMAWLNRFDPLRGLSMETQVVGEDLDKVIAEVFGKGQRVLATGVHAVLAVPPAEVTVQMNRVAAAIGHVGLRLVPEQTIGASLLLHCLPLGFDPQVESSLRRNRRFVSANVADMLPGYGHFRGVGEPKFLYLSRRGEPTAFDPFAAAPAPHMLVIGSTGAGKSVFVNDMILQALRLPARIFVLDKGDSYGRLCRMLGGQHLVVEPEMPLTINPCVGPLTQEKLGILWQLIVEMMQGRSLQDALTREEEGMIERAITDTYQRLPDEEVTLSDISASLQALGTYGIHLAFRLQPFLHDGRYGRYFDGFNELALDHPFTVFELGQLNRDPDLQKIMIMVLINLITQVVAGQPEHGRTKFVFVDEGWSLFESENAGRFLGEAGRTYRKYGTALVSVTQQPRDFLASRGGQAIRDNSPLRILLQQAPEVAEAVGDELTLTPEKKDLFLSLESIPGKFAEALMDTPTNSGVIRIVLPPSVYWMATTNERERHYIDQLARQCGDLETAIAQAAQEYPHGLFGDEAR